MGRTRYDDEQKREAVELALEHGKAEASRRTGIPAGTIGSWMSRAGVATDAAANLSAANAVRLAQMEDRRTRLADRLLEIAELSTEHAVTIMGKAKLSEVVGLFTRAIHDHQLLSGAATARTEVGTVDAAHGLIDELAAQRRKKAV